MVRRRPVKFLKGDGEKTGDKPISGRESNTDLSTIPTTSTTVALDTQESQGLRALFAGFLDLYCEAVPELRRANVKDELRASLIKLGVIPSVLFSDDLTPVRLVCSQLITNLLRTIIGKAAAPEFPFKQPTAVINTSRFRSEFEELDVLGKGGFGIVYKARSLVDKHEYAVKKISARNFEEQLSERILREVQVLASIQHCNIVRYHSAWVEPEFPCGEIYPTRDMIVVRKRRETPRNGVRIEEIFDSDEEETASEGEEDGQPSKECSTTSFESGGDELKKSPVGGKFWNAHSSHDSSSVDISIASKKKLDGKMTGNGDGKMKDEDEGSERSVARVIVRMVIYIQMELCSSTLERELARRSKMPMKSVDGENCFVLFRQLISAIEYIHEQGIIHRDIKPGNIFVKADRGGKMRLLLGDFGLSCLERGKDNDDAIDVVTDCLSPISRHSIGVGTTAYAAPEQLRSSQYGSPVDIYSAGIVLLELFSLFGTTSERLDVVERLRLKRELPPLLTEQWPTVSNLVYRMTEPSPDKRPSAMDILQELSEEGTEIRFLREMVNKQRIEMTVLRREVRRLKSELASKKRKNKGRLSSNSTS